MDEKIITSEEYRAALDIVALFQKQNPDPMMEHNFDKKLEIISGINDYSEKLYELNALCETIANQFTYEMSFIEQAIEQALEEATEEVLDELGWHSIEDVTQNINVRCSSEY